MYRPIVIAGSRSQFADWCRVHQTNPVAAIYVQTPEELRSARLLPGDVFLWGDYTHNSAYLAYCRARWPLKRVA
jgi:hypothetical protein